MSELNMSELNIRSCNELEDYLDKILLIELKATQLSILHQTFRPLIVATLKEISEDYAVFEHVNIKMQNAPEFIFPTDLIIPVDKIAWYMPFDYETRISIY